jgi:drug/metabolite transporter (DMT)-like permease
MKYKNIFIGILFAMLWSSASVATKVGVLSAPPLVLANIRFFIAGILLLGFTYLVKRGEEYRFPTLHEFKQLTIFGFLNTTLYLGVYVYAMKYTAAGIGSLAVSTNPLFIVLLSALWLKRKPSGTEMFCVLLGMAGIGIASFPLLQGSQSTLGGLVLLILSMMIVSVASVYYASIRWSLANLLINGWQVSVAGVLLLPFTFIMSDFGEINFDANFWYSVLWLSVSVSIIGLVCWFYLLRIDTVKASLWLFLCPLFGFFYAWWLMDEPITIYTISGTVLVVLSLYLGQRKRYLK